MKIYQTHLKIVQFLSLYIVILKMSPPKIFWKIGGVNEGGHLPSVYSILNKIYLNGLCFEPRFEPNRTAPNRFLKPEPNRTDKIGSVWRGSRFVFPIPNHIRSFIINSPTRNVGFKLNLLLYFNI